MRQRYAMALYLHHIPTTWGAMLPIVEIEMDRCTDCLTELDAVQSEADRQANVQWTRAGQQAFSWIVCERCKMQQAHAYINTASTRQWCVTSALFSADVWHFSGQGAVPYNLSEQIARLCQWIRWYRWHRRLVNLSYAMSCFTFSNFSFSSARNCIGSSQQ